MSILIREYMGYDKFDVEYNYQWNQQHITENAADLIAADSIMVDVEGIHAVATRNYTRYMDSGLKKSIPTWTNPYRRPVIMHHNEKDGRIIGRIHSVTHVKEKTRSGTGALLFTVNVPDKDGKEQIIDGRLETVSIGIICHDVRCSICGHQIAEEGPCEHDRGQKYDDETCYWDIHEFEGKELSYVIVPSDPYAKNVRIYKPKTTKQEITESLHKGATNKVDKTIAELQEENAALEVKIQELTDANTAMIAEKAELEEAITKLKAEQEELQSKVTLQEATLAQEQELREGTETKLISAKQEIRTTLVESLNILRSVGGKKELAAESIKERSDESLRDAICDLKEELSQTNLPNTVADPTITEKSEDLNVNKEKSTGNVDLQEALEGLLTGVVSAMKK